jgi:hypothetical protein
MADVKLQHFDSILYGSVPGRVLSIGFCFVQYPDNRKFYSKFRIWLIINLWMLPTASSRPLWSCS